MADLFVDWDASYIFLPKWMVAMKASNPYSIVAWHMVKSVRLGLQVFQRIFWAFGADIEAFKYCRPIICLDGTHLCGKCKGNCSLLLVLMGIDSYSHWLSLSRRVNRMTFECGLWLTCD
ncbi:hypothetical protein CFOL_v3_33070 [Cephalotus follicularis]|uniref:Uncharacterized protein n=1 Tax=Cephalotus follicularis TaxID=3775 RepID=A0A1Q3DAV6_CEPFO|nr:hypothetical protein CFOL_v3_33070 [Cephalotus follicularis]